MLIATKTTCVLLMENGAKSDATKPCFKGGSLCCSAAAIAGIARAGESGEGASKNKKKAKVGVQL